MPIFFFVYYSSKAGLQDNTILKKNVLTPFTSGKEPSQPVNALTVLTFFFGPCAGGRLTGGLCILWSWSVYCCKGHVCCF